VNGDFYMRAIATIPAKPAKATLATSRTPAAEEDDSVGASLVVEAGGRTVVEAPVGADDVMVPLEKAVSVYLLRVTVLVRVVVEVSVVVVVASWAMASMGRMTSFILTANPQTTFSFLPSRNWFKMRNGST
jgi:hypothetical protein